MFVYKDVVYIEIDKGKIDIFFVFENWNIGKMEIILEVNFNGVV